MFSISVRMRLQSLKSGTVVCLIVVLSIVMFPGFDVDRCVVPPEIREPILNEFSGELALRHVEMLSVDRNRQADEYLDKFFESDYLVEMAGQYGLSEVKLDFFPAGEIWDAEEADLWLVSPVRKKIAGLEIIPEALAAGSQNADVEAEVVYVGMGRDADFQGKDVRGKLVLGDANVSTLFNAAVVRRGAAGVLGTGSAGVSRNDAGYSMDQIGWQSVSRRGVADKGFGIVLSERQFEEFRGYIERGQKVIMKAHVKVKMYPYKMNVISAAIPGTDPAAGELIMVAHAFERIGTPGANDNCSGVATELEIARTLARLIKNGDLPRPKRTIRFLWVPEISGSQAFMYKYPELEDKLLAAMNFDMSGADLELTDSYLRMKMTPDSRPSYLNDLIGSLLMFVDQTEIRTQWGNNSPFNYRMVPFISSSDHIVFLDAGIPAMQFNHWPDNFYHSSEDRSKYVDPTELKRCGFIAAAGFYYLAVAGTTEAKDLAWESAANGEKWMAEVTRQSARLLEGDPAVIHDRYKAVLNKVSGAFNRASGSVESVLDLAPDDDAKSLVSVLVKNLEKTKTTYEKKLEDIYKLKCAELGIRTKKVTQTSDEKKYSRIIPRKLYKFYSAEYSDAAANVNQHLGGGPQISHRLARSEVPNFIDGKRSILDIYNLVRAEYGYVNTGINEHKFAYVVSPEFPDISLESVAHYINAMEKAGLIELSKK